MSVFSLSDDVTRDYAYGETSPLLRKCRLLPWKPAELDGVSSVTSEPPDEYYEVSPSENTAQTPPQSPVQFHGFLS